MRTDEFWSSDGQSIIHHKDFVVDISNREILIYSEGEYSVSIWFGQGKKSIVIVKSSVQFWDEPHEDIKIIAKDKLLVNIRKALESVNIKLVIDPGNPDFNPIRRLRHDEEEIVYEEYGSTYERKG